MPVGGPTIPNYEDMDAIDKQTWDEVFPPNKK